jgi:phosphatidylinositol alpha-1,6-mannosyltransferase
MSKEQRTILGLFPSLRLWQTGGVERSGRIAWQGIVDHVGSNHARLCCYEARHKSGGDAVEAYHEGREYQGEVASSKFGALVLALRQQWRADTIVVWHLHLLRLVPFLRLPTARVVVFLHGIEAWQQQDWLTRRLLHRVDLFLSNSAYTWQRFMSERLSLAVVSHQIVHLGIGAVLAEECGPPGEVPALLMLGRLQRSEDYKGHREMIAIWPQVLERISDAELWIAGQGDLQADLKIMVRELRLMHRVRFFGWVTDEQKADLLQRCWGFALPSQSEGFGLVYLEAMRMGRPCLVSSWDAGREVVNPPEAGLSADPRDSPAITDAVCRLLTPGQEWQEWSVRARRRYECHFTARHFQRRLLEALGCQHLSTGDGRPRTDEENPQ